ncbi:MAG: hypothetical protein JWP61_1448 [Friedmanniella sp.]|nr:hypothetical protein [Friedmanniella sp.]
MVRWSATLVVPSVHLVHSRTGPAPSPMNSAVTWVSPGWWTLRQLSDHRVDRLFFQR